MSETLEFKTGTARRLLGGLVFWLLLPVLAVLLWAFGWILVWGLAHVLLPQVAAVVLGCAAGLLAVVAVLRPAIRHHRGRAGRTVRVFPAEIEHSSVGGTLRIPFASIADMRLIKGSEDQASAARLELTDLEGRRIELREFPHTYAVHEALVARALPVVAARVEQTLQAGGEHRVERCPAWNKGVLCAGLFALALPGTIGGIAWAMQGGILHVAPLLGALAVWVGWAKTLRSFRATLAGRLVLTSEGISASDAGAVRWGEVCGISVDGATGVVELERLPPLPPLVFSREAPGAEIAIALIRRRLDNPPPRS